MKKGDFIDLDECVINALELFSKAELASIEISYRRPLVVGSGNGAVTGEILFGDKDAVFADESNYLQRIQNSKVDGCVIISASGGKHAPIIAKEMKSRGIETTLITNNPDAPAKEFVSKSLIFLKNHEPYTYNTSTYMGMILSKTHENPAEILQFIKKLKTPKNLKKYDSVFMIVPEEFDKIRGMFMTKFDELFQPIISGRVFTPEQAKHAKTVIPSKKELFLSFGYNNKIFGPKTNRINISLPKNASFAAMMAIGYYVIGQIQKQNKPYFKDNIERYCREASKVFGEEIKPIQ